MPLPCAVEGVLYRVMTLFSQTLVHDHMIAGSSLLSSFVGLFASFPKVSSLKLFLLQNA